MIYLTNAMSVHMLPRMRCGETCSLSLERISTEDVREMLKGSRYRSYFGHRDTAGHLERYLRTKIPMTREWVTITAKDTVIIATLGSTREFAWSEKAARSFEFYKLKYKEE